MVNLEIRLLSAMLYRGDFTPIVKDEIREEHFLTDEGITLYGFINGYQEESDREARFPSFSVVQGRFKNSFIDIQIPDPGEDIGSLCFELRQSWLRAQARIVSTELEELADDVDNPVESIARLSAQLRMAAETVTKPKYEELGSSVLGIIDRYACDDVVPHGIPYPWPTLQEATRGMLRESFIVFAGRPKMRKTFIGLVPVVNAVLHHGIRALVISMEMPTDQIMLRSVATMCNLRYTEFKNSALALDEEARLYELAERFGRFDKDEEDYEYKLKKNLHLPEEARAPGLWVVKGTGRDLSWIESQIDIYDPDIVFVDSFYRIKRKAKSKDTDMLADVTNASRGLKDLASDRKIVMIGTHQINRSGAKDAGGLENLAYSDAIGQDGDLVLRIITGTLNGLDHSALVNIGGRDTPLSGILIRNVPCSDFTEVGGLDSDMSVVERLLASAKARQAETNKDMEDIDDEDEEDLEAENLDEDYVIEAPPKKRKLPIKKGEARRRESVRKMANKVGSKVNSRESMLDP